ncbi:CRISPR-associated helicase/endonuclease Cas3 [Actinomadura rifamycini]|uniref:CRISPR-associated helicase/endonuclease Cas3 n=1 Tax=Actinomadura rifamycini TaxID=31962 RepID=UPI0003FD4233|nr:CRISPR-associated helicase/endonuclease Cas3 [Actinomadura rifamycini]
MGELRAKSSTRPGTPGELLTDHLLNTLKALLAIRARIGDIPGMPPDFWTWAALAALLHDPGKLPDGFQRMIGNTSQQPTIWGERHEVLSLGFVDRLLAHLPDEHRLWVAAAVAGHHRPFTSGLDASSKQTLITQYGDDTSTGFARRFSPADQARLTELVTWLHMTADEFGLPVTRPAPQLSLRQLTDSAHKLFTALMDRWEWSLPSDDPAGATAVLLLGAVTMADHLSSAHASLLTRHPLTADYPAQLTARLTEGGHSLRPQQREAAETNGHLLLRSWTGSGKTEAVLLWAVNQMGDLSRRTGGNPRLFYLLPYLASINAMTERLGNELGSPDGIGVAHSKAASYHLARSLADGCPSEGGDDAADKAHSRAEATRNFRELLRVGTPYQLLKGAMAGPVHSSILTDSANSLFVLDELHAYDTRRLGMILAMMRFWLDVGGRIAVLSATMPTALTKLVGETLDGQTHLIEPPPGTPVPVRHRLQIRQEHLTDDSSLDEMRERLTRNQSVLVVANNVRDAITIFENLAPFCTELHGEHSAHLLHARFRRMDRTAIEEAITTRFAARRPRRPGLLVGTQALEVSLDLDFDACHTSAAELEALIQRFGRVNRLASLDPAPVVVHRPAYTARRSGPDLWADGVYAAAPTQHAWDILTRHDGQTIDERIITTWLDEIYDGPWGAQWRDDVENHRELFHRAFLQFASPFADRTDLAQEFDEQFDGSEAILSNDREDYEDALRGASSKKSGRLYADQFLIPLPAWAKGLGAYDKTLQVRLIDAVYDPRLGLQSINQDPRQIYQPGEVL